MATKSRIKKDRKQVTDATADPFPLAEEVKTYDAHLPGWLDREGQWVLIKGHEFVGFFPRYEKALEAGYEKFGAGPFLAKQILRHEPIYHVSNIEL
jgi:hypothetical protein